MCRQHGDGGKLCGRTLTARGNSAIILYNTDKKRRREKEPFYASREKAPGCKAFMRLKGLGRP